MVRKHGVVQQGLVVAIIERACSPKFTSRLKCFLQGVPIYNMFVVVVVVGAQATQHSIRADKVFTFPNLLAFLVVRN